MKYTIDPKFPTRAMTAREENLIDHIASQTLFLEQELFFNIDSLLSHTSLVLSGERKTRMDVPDPDEIRREIEQLGQLSESIIEDAERERPEQPDFDPEDPDHLSSRPEQNQTIVGTLSDQKKVLERILASASVPVPVPLLGGFGKDAGGRNVVVLYVDNIDAAAGGDPAKAMSLMAYTLVHEYWHSFFHDTGIGTNPTFSCAEEPMAEFGALVTLGHALGSCNPSSPVYADLDGTLMLAIGEVRSKQKSVGFAAAYGFGYYLYDKHLKEAEFLLASYANISRLINPGAAESRIYRYLVYPAYPVNEKNAFCQLVKLISAAKLHGITTSGLCSVLHCKVKQSRLDVFLDALAAGLPRLTNAQIKNAATLYFAMRQHPEVRFTYTKNDGSIRNATGTLMNDLLDPPTTSSATYKGYPDTIVSQYYYDIDSNGWRQFRYDRLLNIGSNIKLTVVP